MDKSVSTCSWHRPVGGDSSVSDLLHKQDYSPSCHSCSLFSAIPTVSQEPLVGASNILCTFQLVLHRQPLSGVPHIILSLSCPAQFSDGLWPTAWQVSLIQKRYLLTWADVEPWQCQKWGGGGQAR